MWRQEGASLIIALAKSPRRRKRRWPKGVAPGVPLTRLRQTLAPVPSAVSAGRRRAAREVGVQTWIRRGKACGVPKILGHYNYTRRARPLRSPVFSVSLLELQIPGCALVVDGTRPGRKTYRCNVRHFERMLRGRKTGEEKDGDCWARRPRQELKDIFVLSLNFVVFLTALSLPFLAFPPATLIIPFAASASLHLNLGPFHATFQLPSSSYTILYTKSNGR
jgi:hypothetical protein